jgi:hypothetical protein
VLGIRVRARVRVVFSSTRDDMAGSTKRTETPTGGGARPPPPQTMLTSPPQQLSAENKMKKTAHRGGSNALEDAKENVEERAAAEKLNEAVDVPPV